MKFEISEQTVRDLEAKIKLHSEELARAQKELDAVNLLMGSSMVSKSSRALMPKSKIEGKSRILHQILSKAATPLKPLDFKKALQESGERVEDWGGKNYVEVHQVLRRELKLRRMVSDESGAYRLSGAYSGSDISDGFLNLQ